MVGIYDDKIIESKKSDIQFKVFHFIRRMMINFSLMVEYYHQKYVDFSPLYQAREDIEKTKHTFFNLEKNMKISGTFMLFHDTEFGNNYL